MNEALNDFYSFYKNQKLNEDDYMDFMQYFNIKNYKDFLKIPNMKEFILNLAKQSNIGKLFGYIIKDAYRRNSETHIILIGTKAMATYNVNVPLLLSRLHGGDELSKTNNNEFVQITNDFVTTV